MSVHIHITKLCEYVVSGNGTIGQKDEYMHVHDYFFMLHMLQ